MNIADDPNFSMSANFFSSWSLDLEAGEFRVDLQSGATHRFQVDVEPSLGGGNISRSVFDWDNGLIGLITKQNHVVFFEPYWPTDPDPAHGRPVVYLDQNHWNTIRLAMTSPDDVTNKSEIEPALRLIELAQDDGIILPVSSGHLRETAPLVGQRRYQQGVAMANFSAGWQMRHPSRVWRDEHMRMFAAEMKIGVPWSATAPVFTLEPHALLDDEVEARDMEADDLQLFLLTLSSPMVILEVLLDQSVRAGASPDAWVTRNQSLTNHLRTSGLTKKQKETAALGYVSQDNPAALQDALNAIGVEPALRSFIVEQQAKLLASQPFLGYYSELFVQRHISSSTLWKPNDLIDLMFLCCAAGYAEYVVAEKQTGTQLIQAQKSRGEPVTVHLNLKSVVDALSDAGVLTATERAARRDGLDE